MEDDSLPDAHTIDNLCPRHKAKVVEMLRQLNELSKRCGFLEAEFERVNGETQHLIDTNSAIAEKVTAEELGLREATRISESAQSQIQQLSLDFQNQQTETNRLRLMVADEETGVQSLRESCRLMRRKYVRICVDTGVSCRLKFVDRAENTDYNRRNHANKEVQVPNRDSQSEIYPFDDDSDMPLRGPACEVDDDTSSLILMLNKS
jgi:chromosome segregation ATPase